MTSYRDAGVDLDAADAVVDSIGDLVQATWGENVVGSFGGFAGGFRIPSSYVDPILMMSTDGIGTKLSLARRLGNVDGVGFDLVAMVVDDLAAAGAEPLALTDYIAVGKLDPREVISIVSSVAAACRSVGVALIGGETAEHPGTLPADALDVAAAAIGVAEGRSLFDVDAIEAGDVLVGVASPNLRSNGFSLVRAIVGDAVADVSVDGQPLADLLIAPSVIYAPAAVAARSQAKAFVHVTGGGLVGNLPRVLPADLGAAVDDQSWTTPAIFDYLQETGDLSTEEMRRVFNMGIGFVAVCSPDRAAAVEAQFSTFGHTTYRIGTVTQSPEGLTYTH